MKSYKSLLLVLALGLGALLTVPAPAADPVVSPEQINKLIETMGSSDFEAREKATTQLDAIGIPALELLRKGSKSDDAEVRRRCEELVGKIEKRVESVKVAAPTKVHLVYKETPLAEAVKDFAKKSGYPINVMDPQGKLKDRKITLDTGEVTFWQAFDQFCAHANLVEASANDMLQLQPGLINPNPNANPIKRPLRPGVVPVPGPNAVPGAVPVPAPAPDKQPAKQPLEEKPEAPQKPEPEAQAPAQPAVRPALARAQLQIRGPAILPAQPIQIGAGQLGAAMLGFQGMGMMGMMGQANQITLIDGKPQTLPTDYSSAIRVRTSDHVKQQGKAPEGEIRLGLQLTAEPKIQLQQVVAVRVEKAIDDQDQKLVQLMNMAPGANPGVPGFPGLPPGPGGFGIAGAGFGGAGIGGMAFGGGLGFNGVGAASQYAVIQLKKGEKASKTLKEVTGVITAQVMTAAQPAITVDNIMKMVGKEVKGKDGGLIKVAEATRAANGQVRVRFEFEAPGNAGNAGNPFGVIVPNIRIQPIAPAPPVPPQGQAPGQKQLQVQVQAQPIARPGVVQIQIGGPAVGGVNFIGGFGAGNSGFTLVDDKGNSIQPMGFSQQIRQVGNTLKIEHVLMFQVAKGQEPAKLVYSTSKSVMIDVPFSLKEVTIP